MELLALVIINIVFGIILYYAVSIKVTNSVRDYQIVKLKKEIQAHTLSFFKESESYLALMDSRIAVLKNLLHKAESMGINFQDIPEIDHKNPDNVYEDESDSKPILQKIEKPKKNVNYKETKPKNKQTSISRSVEKKRVEEGSLLSGFVAGLGKGLKSIFGVKEDAFADLEIEPSSKSGKNSVIDVSIGGNPLDSDEVVLDNLNANNSFQAVFNQVNNPYSQSAKQKDSIQISVSAALEELHKDATKVEKVVHLLKKGFSHSDISEEMGLAIPEISLIETIKIERSRRI